MLVANRSCLQSENYGVLKWNPENGGRGLKKENITSECWGPEWSPTGGKSWDGPCRQEGETKSESGWAFQVECFLNKSIEVEMPMWWGHKMPLWGTGKWWEHKKPVGRQQEMKLERWVGGSVLNPFRQTVWAELKILVDYHYPYPPPPFYSVFKNKTKKQNKCKKS